MLVNCTASVFVMPGLVPGIHVFAATKAWMAGTSPAMTNKWVKPDGNGPRPAARVTSEHSDG
jgi:hypothetical protein